MNAGETWEYSATYQLNEDSFVDGADVVNDVEVTAAVDATSADLDAQTARATTELTVEGDFDIVKNASISGGAIPAAGVNVGDTITYTYALTNTGNVPINSITLVDAHSGSGALVFQSCTFTEATTPNTSVTSSWGGADFVLSQLGAGDEADCTATYQVTQTDVDSQ